MNKSPFPELDYEGLFFVEGPKGFTTERGLTCEPTIIAFTSGALANKNRPEGHKIVYLLLDTLHEFATKGTQVIEVFGENSQWVHYCGKPAKETNHEQKTR